MRPLDNREQRKSTGIANVRMCLKTYLGWMDGFPISQSHGQLQWHMRPKIGDTATRSVSLNRDTLRRANTGLTRLTTQLAHATRKVVGNLENWRERVSNLLESLKVVIHENQNRLNDIPLECLDRREIQNVLELIRRFPQLRELLSAIIWSQWACPERRALLLTWVARYAPLIASYAESGNAQKRLRTLLLLADLSLLDSSEDFGAFQRLLFNALTLDVTSACFPHEALVFVFSLKNWQKGQAQPTVPALPAADLEATIISLLDWLIRQEAAVRQLTFRMVALTFRFPALENWHESWSTFRKQATAAVDRLNTLITSLSSAAFHMEACRIAEELRVLLDLCGSTIITSGVLDSIHLPWLHDCSRSQIVAALQFEVDGYAFLEMLKLIGPESKIGTEQITGVMNLYQHFRRAGWSDVVPMLLRTQRVTDATRLSMLLSIATAFAERPDVEPRTAEADVPLWAVNLPVVFARTSGGGVVGRCLLALGNSGTLMTFNAYCHDETFPFAEHLATFAAQLADDMRTVVSHNDSVGFLVAPDWYNDGACDLGHSVFRDESPLRVAIRAATESDIVDVALTALGNVGLSDTILEMLVELPEFKSRPALILALIPHFERREIQLGVSSILRAALLAFKAGERTFASRVLLKYGPVYIRQHQTRTGFTEEAVELLQALITLHPSSALRLLRETRRRSIRSDVEESDESRRELLASCFTALARPKPVAAMKNQTWGTGT